MLMTRNDIEQLFKRLPPTAEPPQRGAAVLVPLTQREEEVCVLLEVRAAALRHQPGEICFPGGGMEPGEDAAACALRETEEELGLTAAQIDLLAPLPALRHSSGQRVEAVLGWVNSLEGLRLQREEVAEAFLLPLAWLRANPPKWAAYATVAELDTAPEELLPFLPHYRRERRTPIWVYQGHVIWGLTAKVLVDLLETLSGVAD
ncbi:MAG: CoA pyrophosphatase [Clostridiales bacterium]|nr:CoA pyrophosphatase [Clostridiales bacterium]